MRIGILSFTTSSNNYGQLLQCFALQKYLRKAGHNAKHILYIPPSARSTSRGIGGAFKLVRRYLDFGFIYDKIRSKVRPMLGDESRAFSKFLGNQIEVFSTIYSNPAELLNDPPETDALIVGSDQVWGRPLGTEDSKVWFLKFGMPDTLRISYAASIGRNLSESELPRFKEEVSGLDFVSVREQKALETCVECGVDAKLVLDPTLLLNECDYPIAGTNACGDSSIAPKEPFIFAYILNVLTEKDLGWGPIEEYAQTKGLDVVPVYSSGYYSAYPIITGHDPVFPTIPQWLDLVKRSEAVVTTSFHGMVFSILMHRPFLVIPLSGKHSGGNDRIVTLLSELGLKNRIYNPSIPVSEQMENRINWDDVDEKLSLLRTKSEAFLFEALAGE